MNDLIMFLIFFIVFFAFTCLARWYIIKDLNREERKKYWEELKERHNDYR